MSFRLLGLSLAASCDSGLFLAASPASVSADSSRPAAPAMNWRRLKYTDSLVISDGKWSAGFLINMAALLSFPFGRSNTIDLTVISRIFSYRGQYRAVLPKC
ncbi:Uncharacterised protein [Chromobacterium violaceum]|uniref:Secreted protein n=1 Tax=Chromobacterium violaceum TaxID=536 RepID=A0A447T723_CHRVL|nr:Uncharacterised protein [Chromobacterium violaceum]